MTIVYREMTICILALGISSCTGSSFTGTAGQTKAPEKTVASGDAKPTPSKVPVASSPFSTPSPTLPIPEPLIVNNSQHLPDSIQNISVSAQEGRSVQACFSYDARKMEFLVNTGQAHHGHYCNRAVFTVGMSGMNVGSINLNNRSGDPGIFDPGGGGLGSGGPSKFGGSFAGRWINGIFDVQIQCALPNCHSDVTFLSIIGEVVMPSGQIKWLKIDQGIIYPDQRYSYDFGKFALTDYRPSFGPFCELH